MLNGSNPARLTKGQGTQLHYSLITIDVPNIPIHKMHVKTLDTFWPFYRLEKIEKSK